MLDEDLQAARAAVFMARAATLPPADGARPDPSRIRLRRVGEPDVDLSPDEAAEVFAKAGKPVCMSAAYADGTLSVQTWRPGEEEMDIISSSYVPRHLLPEHTRQKLARSPSPRVLLRGGGDTLLVDLAALDVLARDYLQYLSFFPLIREPSRREMRNGAPLALDIAGARVLGCFVERGP